MNRNEVREKVRGNAVGDDEADLTLQPAERELLEPGPTLKGSEINHT